MTFLKRNQSAESGKDEKKGKRKKSIDGGKIIFFKIFNSLWRALQLCSSSNEQVRVGRMRMVRRRCGRRSRGSKSLSSNAALRQRNISALQKGQSWLSAWLSLNSRWNWITNWQISDLRLCHAKWCFQGICHWTCGHWFMWSECDLTWTLERLLVFQIEVPQAADTLNSYFTNFCPLNNN